VQAVDGSNYRQQLRRLSRDNDRLRAERDHLYQQLQHAVLLDADQLARFAATAQAEGVSLPVARRLLLPLLQHETPSVPQLGRWTHAAALNAEALLPVLDDVVRPQVEQEAADEISFGRRPCLMVVEPHSLCWLTGRLADDRNGETWAEEFRRLPKLKQVTRDGGNGLAKGVGRNDRCHKPQMRNLLRPDTPARFRVKAESAEVERSVPERACQAETVFLRVTA
jgi:hypothetical protein